MRCDIVFVYRTCLPLSASEGLLLSALSWAIGTFPISLSFSLFLSLSLCFSLSMSWAIGIFPISHCLEFPNLPFACDGLPEHEHMMPLLDTHTREKKKQPSAVCAYGRRWCCYFSCLASGKIRHMYTHTHTHTQINIHIYIYIYIYIYSERERERERESKLACMRYCMEICSTKSRTLFCEGSLFVGPDALLRLALGDCCRLPCG